VLDVLIAQTGAPPFNPRDAVRKFAAELKAWGLSRVTGDAYAGQTFRRDFEDLEIVYSVSHRTKSEIYDAFEPKLNAGEVELLDHPKLTEKLLTLVLKNGKIDHLPGDHDDHANAACGAIALASAREIEPVICGPLLIGLDQPRYFPESDIYRGGAEAAAARDPRPSGFTVTGPDWPSPIRRNF
jgi:hypothetical protein